MRLDGPDRQDQCPLGPDEVAVVVHPAPVVVRVELAQEQDPGIVAMHAPRVEQRLQGALLGRRQVVAIQVGRLELDVEIADRPEPLRGLAQPVR